MAPQYLSQLCRPVTVVPGRQHVRSSRRGQLDVYRLTTYGGRSFVLCCCYRVDSLCDSLKDTTLYSVTI